jgi:hypothetical protein
LEAFVNRIAKILTGLSLSLLFFVATANAESYGQGVTANIPFEFTVGRNVFPAGHYEFLRNGSNFVLVRGADGRSLVTLASASMDSSGPPWRTKKSMLKFTNVDGRHVLAAIWNEQAGHGNEFRAAKTASITTASK